MKEEKEFYIPKEDPEELVDLSIDFDRKLIQSFDIQNKWDLFRKAVQDVPNTCFYLLNEKELQKRAQIFLEEFEKGKSNRYVAYAIKANPFTRIIEILRDSGIHSFDCASIDEIIRVQKIYAQTNTKSPKVFFNHPEKKSEEITMSSFREVYHFTVDTHKEVDRVFDNYKGKKPLEIVSRVVPKIHQKSTSKIPLFKKFGSTVEKGNEILDSTELKAKERGIKLRKGVSIHIGSQNFVPETHTLTIEQLLEDLSKHHLQDLKSINLGGGMPANQFKGVRANERSLRNYLKHLDIIVTEKLEQIVGDKGKIIIEPGRGMVATCTDLMVPIVNIKKGGSTKYLYMDNGIFSSFSDAYVHKWKFPFRAVSRAPLLGGDRNH